MIILTVIAAILIAFLITSAINKIYFVPEGMMMITIRFGRFSAVYKSGLAILMPFENPLAIGSKPYDGEGIVVQNIFLPTLFRFDPDNVDVCSRRSTVVNVDPVMMLKVESMEKLYFTCPSEDPFSLLVGKMEDMLNETCRTYDTITREHFKEIASKTKAAMVPFCQSFGLKMESFELQNMQLSDERMAMEAEAENRNRAMLLEHERWRIEHESEMSRIESEEACRLRKIRSEQAIHAAQMECDLINARKRKEIASVEAESQLAFIQMLEQQKLSDSYYRQAQINAQNELSKSVLSGSHTVYVMDHDKIFCNHLFPPQQNN